MDCRSFWPQTGAMTTATQDIDRGSTSYTVVSSHNTSQGVVTWVRCDLCAGLRMLLQPARPGDASIAAGHHADRCPNCD